MRVEIYTTGSNIPELMDGDPRHSTWMFRLIEQHSSATPFMVVAFDRDKEAGHLLAIRFRDLRILPPGYYVWYSIHGEGVIAENHNKEEVFAALLDKLFTLFDIHHTFIEVRNLKDAKFAYGRLSDRLFFPRRDIRIYLSLHSISPEKRVTRSYKTLIRKAEKRGVTYGRAQNESETIEALHILRRHYINKVRRHLPPIGLLHALVVNNKNSAALFVVRYKGKIIGCSICLYDKERAYMAYSCGLRVSYRNEYPGIIAVWAAIKDAHQQGYSHFEFLEAKNAKAGSGYLNFILNFGGKQTGVLRWYHFKWRWINKIMRSIYV